MDFRDVDIEGIHPNLKRFAVYYQKLALGAVLPKKDMFELRDVHWLYGFINLVDILDNGADYRYNHVGDFWKAILNYDITGVRLSELEDCGRFANVRINYNNAVETRSPRYRIAELIWPGGKSVKVERIVVPLTDDDGNIVQLVVAAQCSEPLDEVLAGRGGGEAQLIVELTSPSLGGFP